MPTISKLYCLSHVLSTLFVLLTYTCIIRSTLHTRPLNQSKFTMLGARQTDVPEKERRPAHQQRHLRPNGAPAGDTSGNFQALLVSDLLGQHTQAQFLQLIKNLK